MAKVYADELDAALSSKTFDIFTSEETESKTLSDAIDNFINNHKDVLSGEQYDNFRGQFQEICSALSMRMSLAASLGAAIKEALQLLKDYLGEDTFLDSSQLEEYQQEREICVKSIESLKAMLNKTRQVEKNGITVTEHVYNSSEINAKIATAQETLNELDRIIEKIKGLDAIYAQAESILASAFSSIDSFKSTVSNFKPGGLYSYSIA